MGMLLGLVGIAPVMAAGSSRTPADATPHATAAAPGSTTQPPFDSGPIVLLLVAVGVGAMGLLSREPEPTRHVVRR